MNAKFMGDVKKRALDLADTMHKAIESNYDGHAPGMHGMTDMEHRVWFEGMVASNPNWAVALPYVKGGNREVSRYMRTVAKDNEGVF